MARLLNDDEIKIFSTNGYVIVPKFFSDEEIGKLYHIATADSVIKENALDLNDQTGKKTKLTLWFTPGDDVYSLLIRSNRMVNSIAKLLDSDSPVCHFHTKLMQKEPRVGGAWESGERAAGRTLDGSFVLHCSHRTHGVGMIDVREVVAADAAVASLGATSAITFLVGTASHCHGALQRVVIEG